MAPPTRIALLSATILMLSACASVRPDAGARRGPRVGNDIPSTIVVANYHFSEIVVFADDGQGRVRLGRVPSMRSGRFTTPEALSHGQRLRIAARPVEGRGEYVSSTIPIHPRQYVEVTVLNNLALSSWATWPR